MQNQCRPTPWPYGPLTAQRSRLLLLANWTPAPQANWLGEDHEHYPHQAPRYRGLGRVTLAPFFLGAQSWLTCVIKK